MSPSTTQSRSRSGRAALPFTLPRLKFFPQPPIYELMLRLNLLLLLMANTALADPTIYVSERGDCPDRATLLSTLRLHLRHHDAEARPSAGAISVSLIDLGPRYLV